MTIPSSPSSTPRIIEAEAVAPLSKVDEILLESFAKDVAAQATRLDDLAKQLVALFIAVPSVFAVILKMVSGAGGILATSQLTVLSFTTWLLSLAFSLACLMPERCEVDPDSLSDIQNYFTQSAKRKYILLCCACVFGVVGISLAVFSML